MPNTINNNTTDPFSDVISQKLENHELPIDATLWKEIEIQLNSKKKRIIPFWLWLSGGAAVAALALLFILHPMTETRDAFVQSTKVPQPIEKKTSIANYQHSINAKHLKCNLVQKELVNNYRSPKVSQSTKTTGKEVDLKTLESNQVQSTIALDNRPGQISLNDSVERNRIYNHTTENTQNREHDIAQAVTSSKDSISKKNRNIPNSLREEPEYKPIAGTKNRSSWLLAAAIGSNGSVPSGNGNFESALGDRNIVTATTSYINIMTPNEFSTITYAAPVSAGLILRKNLDKEFSLESGLVYTYLLTTFEGNTMQQNNAKLHLHYIGIPLDLVAQVWSHPKFEIYLSGGGMIEKGLKSVYVQNQHINSRIIATTVTSNISGVQWSVHAGTGITYKIERHIGIYFEPKLSYYFENKQPLSARTDNPVVIGLTAGVRFQFK